MLADVNTYAAAGEQVENLLLAEGIACAKYVYPTSPEPDETAVGSAIMHFDPACDVVLAVGSGVIGDISKILANVSGKEYVIVATAPSMDGYASATSSMTRDGLKVSLPSRCARIIIGDTDILKSAPADTLVSGLGDMLAKYVSLAEWRISALITGEYYCETVADLVRSSLKKCVEHADGLVQRDPDAVEAVFNGLVTAGAAMAYANASRPASGIEHYFSHLWDMRGVEFGEPISTHGIQCAVGTLLAARLYERILTVVPEWQRGIDYAQAFDVTVWREELSRFLGRGAEAIIRLDEKEQKYSIPKHKARLKTILEKWDEITAIIREEIPSAKEVEALLDRIGCPQTTEAWGLSADVIPETFKATKDIRDKYILSRLAFDLGILDELADTLSEKDP
jgi:glycerol-1-phosphate dehydrogenase [NAD(P)+]